MHLIHQPQIGHYLVHSESQLETLYDVDILAHEGQGHCTCPDWLNRIGPAIDRGELPARRFCKHIIEAREHFADLCIERTLTMMRAPQKDG